MRAKINVRCLMIDLNLTVERIRAFVSARALPKYTPARAAGDTLAHGPPSGAGAYVCEEGEQQSAKLDSLISI